MIAKIKKWFWNTLIAIDQLANAILFGDPDETISSRSGKWARDHENDKNWRYIIAKPLCLVLDKIDDNHCEKSIESDEGKDGVIK